MCFEDEKWAPGALAAIGVLSFTIPFEAVTIMMKEGRWYNVLTGLAIAFWLLGIILLLGGACGDQEAAQKAACAVAARKAAAAAGPKATTISAKNALRLKVAGTICGLVALILLSFAQLPWSDDTCNKQTTECVSCCWTSPNVTDCRGACHWRLSEFVDSPADPIAGRTECGTYRQQRDLKCVCHVNGTTHVEEFEHASCANATLPRAWNITLFPDLLTQNRTDNKNCSCSWMLGDWSACTGGEQTRPVLCGAVRPSPPGTAPFTITCQKSKCNNITQISARQC